MSEETKKQNRLYMSDEQKKRPLTFSATELQKQFINRLVDDNHCRSMSDMIIKLLFDKKFRENFQDIPVDELERSLF